MFRKEVILNKLVIVLMLLLIFSYYSMFGVRLILMSLVTILVIVGLSFKNIPKAVSADFLIFILILLISAILSLIGGDFSVLFSIIIFFALTYWPALIGKKEVLSINLDAVMLSYIAAACVCALGVVSQSFIFSIFGFEFGKIDFYKGRIGFGFLWLDYSFLSLFIASSIPFVLVLKRNIFKFLIVLLLLSGSIATSARTGIFSFLLVSILFFLYQLFRGFILGKLNKNVVLVAIGIVIIFVSVYLGTQYIATREYSISGSGRIEGYIQAVLAYLEAPIFGLMFDVGYYKENIGVIPHNAIVYMFVFGGGIVGGLFIVWISLVLVRANSLDIKLKFSLFTFLCGMQLIPSPFSTYSFAAILSLVNIYTIQKKLLPLQGREAL